MTEDELQDWLGTYCEFTVDDYGATGYAIPYEKIGSLVRFINDEKQKRNVGPTRATNGEEAASESGG